MKTVLIVFGFLYSFTLVGQDVVPKAKTKEERKAERKKMTLEQRIEDTLPVDVSLPSAKLNLPGGNKISSLEDAKKYVNETVPNYGKEVKSRAKKASQDLKKTQAKAFNGKSYKDVAVVKTILKRGSGKNLHYREFYVVKESGKPLSYRRLNTWYDEKKKQISEALSRDVKTNKLLHGPYREYRGDKLVKDGHYFMGVKDGRWMEYDAKDFTLLVKENYNKGFFADSEISYFEGDSSKIEEVLPKQFGKVTGKYFKFYKDGTLAEEGEYDSGKKIKKWVEYYEGGNRRKKETQHPNSFLDEDEPFVVMEYDEKGKITFEQKKTN